MLVLWKTVEFSQTNEQSMRRLNTSLDVFLGLVLSHGQVERHPVARIVDMMESSDPVQRDDQAASCHVYSLREEIVTSQSSLNPRHEAQHPIAASTSVIQPSNVPNLVDTGVEGDVILFEGHLRLNRCSYSSVDAIPIEQLSTHDVLASIYHVQVVANVQQLTIREVDTSHDDEFVATVAAATLHLSSSSSLLQLSQRSIHRLLDTYVVCHHPLNDPKCPIAN
ncbi:hypothetical protein DYB36_002787 [Aphanomyces astaci]|uniref:Uncharacterized protein n=1 Tax=Aphanomyces astaci TaxID=112090 RepID=A0A396ZUD8_APHAT|nr:hypothetical protein DYB36_002787 [Aphanomyces astaci]